MSTIETVLANITAAIEGITPDSFPTTGFGLVEDAQTAKSLRAFELFITRIEPITGGALKRSSDYVQTVHFAVHIYYPPVHSSAAFNAMTVQDSAAIINALKDCDVRSLGATEISWSNTHIKVDRAKSDALMTLSFYTRILEV